MKTQEELKKIVNEKYSLIAEQSDTENCGCGCGCADTNEPKHSVLSGDYKNLTGYLPEADLKLGCGVPTKHARISAGDTVVDLGSGAGNDCFVAATLTGTSGRVIGIDMSEAMVRKAVKNAENAGTGNIEFRLGEIEDMPVEEGTADTVISNCVMNLVPDKHKAFGETYRILKPGGHFSISDMVIRGNMPESLRKDAEMYAGCVSGALEIEEYLQVIREAGFINIQVLDERKTLLPEDLLLKHRNDNGDESFDYFQAGRNGLYSVTVYAEKPAG